MKTRILPLIPLFSLFCNDSSFGAATGELNITQFGARCDEVSDDSPGVNAAIAATPVEGATIRICRVTTLLTPVTINKNNIRIAGYGSGSTVVSLPNGHMFDVFTAAASSATEFEGFTITSYGKVSPAPVYGIRQTGSSSHMRINDVAMINLNSGIAIVGSQTRVNNTRMYGTEPTSGNGIAVSLPPATEVAELYNLYISGGRNCIAVQSGTSIAIAHTQATGCTHALTVSPSTGQFANFFSITDFWADNSKDVGIDLNGGAGQISGVRISSSWIGSNHGAGLRATGTVTGLTIGGGNVIQGQASGYGIDIQQGGTYAGLMIDGNLISGNKTGVNIGAGVSDFSITNNVIAAGSFPGNSFGGVYVAPGASNDYVIAGNRACGNGGNNGCGTTAGVIDNGAGANKIVTNNLQ